MAFAFLLPFSLASGALIKATDFLEGKKKFKTFLPILSLVAGALVGFLISSHYAFATVFLAVITANLAYGKLDSRAFWFFLAVVFLSIAVLGIAPINYVVFVFILASAWLDEFLHDRRLLGFFSEHRLLTTVIALAVPLVLFQDVFFFFAMFSFDLGYQSTSFFAEKK